MKAAIPAALLILIMGCISKPDKHPEISETPLAIGDCIVLDHIHSGPGRRLTIDTNGCIDMPLLGKVRIADKTQTEAEEVLNSEYVARKILRRSPEFTLELCADRESGKIKNYWLRRGINAGR